MMVLDQNDGTVGTSATAGEQTPHLLLHQVFELCDLVGVLGVAGDVLLIKESLEKEEHSRDHQITVHVWLRDQRSDSQILPLDVLRHPHQQ